MDLDSWLRFLHIVAAVAFIGGIFARQVVRGRAAQTDDLRRFATLSEAAGLIETRLTQAKEKGETIEKDGESIEIGVPEQMRAMAAMIIPLGRPAQPEEAAGPVLFLCSPLANYVHGQVLNVTGGQFGGMFT